MILGKAELVLHTYCDYLDMKSHFNFRKFWPEERLYTANPDALAKRRDLKMFIRVAEEIGDNPQERKNLLITAFLNNQKSWILDVISKENYAANKERVKYLRHYEEAFFDDLHNYLKQCQAEGISFVDSITKNDPSFVWSQMGKGLRNETLILLDFILPFFSLKSAHAHINYNSQILKRYSHFIFDNFENARTMRAYIHEELINQS